MSEHDVDAVVERCARANCAIDGDNCMSKCSYGNCRGPMDMISHEMDTVRRIFAALRPGDRLPGGGVWAPEEPTIAMIQAARHDWYHRHGPESRTLHGVNIMDIYRAMLAAASEGEP